MHDRCRKTASAGRRSRRHAGADEPRHVRVQLLRARAFAYAAVGDIKGIERSLKKLVDVNPHLMGMFIGVKRTHPLIERTAKQLLMKSGAVPRKMVRQKM